MELHQLHYVIKVAEHLHFSKAANYLGITQPSLSQQIDKLEKELGVRLFERQTRSVKVTADGEAFIVHAQRVLSELDQLGATMKSLARSKKTRLRIGAFVPNMGPCNLAILFQRFQENFPDISIRLSEKCGSHELYKPLKSGLIDGAFLVPSPECMADQMMVRHTLIPGTVNIVIKKGHHLASQQTILLQDLAKENCVSMSHTYSIYSTVIDVFRTNGFNLKIVSYCNQVDTMVDLVSQGFGISFLSSQFAELISHPDIVIRPLEPAIERNLSFVYPANRTLSPALITFRNFILDTFHQTPQLTQKCLAK